MEIIQKNEDKKLILEVSGRLDTVTAPELEAKLGETLTDQEILEMDFAGLEYVSSAGLRVILGAQKKMNKQGSLVIKNVNETIMEVFEITGFADILTIE